MGVYTTNGLPANESGRAAAWNALYATEMSRVGFIPGDRSGFEAELRIGSLGPVRLARLSVTNCSVERLQRDIAAGAPRIYNFLLQAKGTSQFYHCGHESRLSEGDFVLCDTTLPHYWRTTDHSTTIMTRVERSALRDYLPTPERFSGLRLGRAEGLTHTVGAMVQSLTAPVEAGSCIGHEARVARHLLELIALSYTMGFEGNSQGSAIVWQRRNDILRYIEQHLRDPELCPTSIAAGLRLEPRYLRAIFSLSGDRVSAYVLRRRLEQCAHQMRDPALDGRTLTEIAFSWGFNSASHFARTFRAHYGVAPRDYRGTVQ